MMSLPPGFSFSAMSEAEVAELGAWAADEGWNPGRNDLAIARAVDPDAFVALREGGALAGAGSIFSYDGRFGFMGLFIMRPEWRGGGLGGALWRWRLARLKERLAPGAAIGMDGVFDMVPFYERGGFREAYRHIRHQGTAAGAPDPAAVRDVDPLLADILAYDGPMFPAPREKFLTLWVTQPGAFVSGVYEKGTLAGYGVARPCQAGFKIGPLFANDPQIARRLLSDLMSRIAGKQVQIDVPECKPAAMALAARFRLKEVFGCMRLYNGPAPKLATERIYGVTSLEFG
jgi:GNAT superfamily N-acetyltransferase